MVGLLGCGCCGPVAPSEFCQSDVFEYQLLEDFSPTFDPYFSQNLPDSGVAGLEIVNSACQCIGFQQFNSQLTRGYGYAVFRKKTLSEPIEVSLKLVQFSDARYATNPGFVFGQTAIQAQCVIDTDIPGGYSSSRLYSTYSAYALADYNIGSSYYLQTQRNITGTKLNIRPAVGDVFGVRLSEFSSDPDPAKVKPAKAEFVLNGQVRFTVTDSSKLPSFRACPVRTGYEISQPYFKMMMGFNAITIGTVDVRADDFSHESP